MAGKSYKMTRSEITIEEAVNNGYSELGSLRDEMQERADNMEGSNMSPSAGL